MIHPPCRQSPCVCTTGPSRARYVPRTVDCQTPSLGRRAWRAVCSSQVRSVRSLEPCAREPTSPTYIDGTQARRHPSLACEGLPCLPYDMPHMMYVRRQNADAKARRCVPTDLEPGSLHFSAEEQPYCCFTSPPPSLPSLQIRLISRLMIVPLTRTNGSSPEDSPLMTPASMCACHASTPREFKLRPCFESFYEELPAKFKHCY